MKRGRQIAASFLPLALADQCRAFSLEEANALANSIMEHDDGTNLNLVRNHIIYYKREIQELCETEGIFKPDVFYRELPPEVDDNYMAKSEQIRQEAVSILSRLTESNEYNRLRTAIEHDDLLTMRRYSYEF